MRRTASSNRAAPDATVLHELALAALARRALTRKTLADALDRKIVAWARQAQRTSEADDVERTVERARSEAAAVVARLVEVGLVDDERFAVARAERLVRNGKSRRAIAVHLASKGIDPNTARAAISTDPEDELRAALVLARRRRLGPFARDEGELDREQARSSRQKALATLARAGFGMGVAERVLRIDREEAEARLRGHGAL